MSAPPPARLEEAGVVADPRRRRLILLAMCVALVAVVASVSGLNVAQQAMAADLGASQSALLWIINGYTIALASLLLPLGAVGDRWGRKRLLVGGLVVFTGANLVAALAGSTDVLLAARVAAGVGAAMVMPITLSVITSSFPTAEKPRAVALWAGFSGAGAIIGLFASSAIVDLATWPWVFALPVVMGVAALALSVVAVPDSREAAHARFDLGGSVLSAVAIGGLVLGIHEGPERGWADPSRWPASSPAAWPWSASSPGRPATRRPSSTSGCSATAAWPPAR
jgi:MFS family permease